MRDGKRSIGTQILFAGLNEFDTSQSIGSGASFACASVPTLTRCAERQSAATFEIRRQASKVGQIERRSFDETERRLSDRQSLAIVRRRGTRFFTLLRLSRTGGMPHPRRESTRWRALTPRWPASSALAACKTTRVNHSAHVK